MSFKNLRRLEMKILKNAGSFEIVMPKNRPELNSGLFLY